MKARIVGDAIQKAHDQVWQYSTLWPMSIEQEEQIASIMATLIQAVKAFGVVAGDVAQHNKKLEAETPGRAFKPCGNFFWADVERKKLAKKADRLRIEIVKIDRKLAELH